MNGILNFLKYNKVKHEVVQKTPTQLTIVTKGGVITIEDRVIPHQYRGRYTQQIKTFFNSTHTCNIYDTLYKEVIKK